MSLSERIKKIQNGAKSLRWGCTRHSETETLFVVGHTSYPREVHYFMVNDKFEIYDCDSSKWRVEKFCESEDEVIQEVLRLLKLWFPAKS